jgi:mannosylglycerate hydrolase MGH1-like protein
MSLSVDDVALRREAVRILVGNWRGASTVPSPTLYPHQWSWDSAFIAIGTSHWSQRRAETELVSLFGGQWADGRMPHIVFDPAVSADAYFPGPAFWRSREVDADNPLDTSGIVQPPVHARAALDVLNNARDPVQATAFLRRVYPRLRAQHHYLREHRVVDGLGLAAIVHPWESGLDNSPLWDAPLARVAVDLSLLRRYTRRDIEHAGAGERPTDEDYARYIRLAEAYRDSGYDDARYAPAAEFRVVDPLFNAMWAWSEEALAAIAEAVEADPEPHLKQASELTQALVDVLFDDTTGTFAAFDAVERRQIRRRTVAGVVPIVLSGLPADTVRSLALQLNSHHFGLLDDAVTGVPSYDLRAKDFDSQLYWRGPTWLNTTWLVWRGLRVHGLDEMSDKLANAMLQLAHTSGFREYFDPHTRSGHGTREFGWSAALILDVLETLENPSPRSGRPA